MLVGAGVQWIERSDRTDPKDACRVIEANVDSTLVHHAMPIE
jgi:hypothetical protein